MNEFISKLRKFILGRMHSFWMSTNLMYDSISEFWLNISLITLNKWARKKIYSHWWPFHAFQIQFSERYFAIYDNNIDWLNLLYIIWNNYGTQKMKYANIIHVEHPTRPFHKSFEGDINGIETYYLFSFFYVMNINLRQFVILLFEAILF